MLKNSPLEPEDIKRLVLAYQQTLHALSLRERDDPLTEIVAKKVIEIRQAGIRDPAQICRLAIKGLGLP